MLGQGTGYLGLIRLTTARIWGSHHLPPYSILCSSSLHLHPNGSFSQDSQSGVPKLSQFGLPKLWVLITLRPELRSRQSLNQSCSFPREISNGLSHFTCMHRNWVDSRLLVVRSQIGSLTPSPFFDHNLCYRCPNGSCEAILDIYTSRNFQRYKKRLNTRCFDPFNRALSFWESRRTPTSHFRECEWQLHISLKVGLRHRQSQLSCTFKSLHTKIIILINTMHYSQKNVQFVLYRHLNKLSPYMMHSQAPG